MPQRKKSRSERLNEELNPFQDTADAAFQEDQPTVEAYDHDEDEVRGSKRRGKQVLRRRGPLDGSLSTGKYAAVPRGAAEDEDAGDGDFDLDDMDDVFGMLDEDVEKSTALKTQEDLANYLEQRAAPKRKKRTVKKSAEEGSDGDGDDDEPARDYSMLDAGDAEVMRQIDELKRSAKLAVTTDENADDDTRAAREREVDVARDAVALSTQLLSLRLAMQPAVAAALRLPQYYSLKEFERQSGRVAEAADDVRQAARELAATTIRLMAPGSSISHSSSDKLWSTLSKHHKATMDRVNAGVERWGHRAQVSGDPKLAAVNRPLLEQIRGVIAGKQRLLHRAQRNRGHVHIFGHPQHFEKTPADRAVAIADGDVDREIFDDCDFVKDLALHHGGTVAKAVEKITPEDKMKSEAKKGHHRKTKGRTVNYDPRAKIVGFMVPVPYEETERYEALLPSLFGGNDASA